MSEKVLGIQHESPVAWSPNGEILAFVSGNHSIYLTSPHEGRFRVSKMLDGHDLPVKALLWHPEDNNTLISAGPEGYFVWDIAAAEVVTKRPADGRDGNHESDVEVLCWAMGSLNLITGSRDTSIKVWATEPDASDKAGETKYRLLETIMGHKSTVLAVSFNMATTTLASAGRDSSIKLWDCSSLAEEFRAKRKDDSGVTCQLIANIDGHRGDVTTLTWSPDGATIFSGARDNTMKVWNATLHLEIRVLQDRAQGQEGRHRGDVRRILLTHDGKNLITAGLDSKVKTWQLAPEEEIVAAVLDMEALEREREETEANILAQILGSSGLNTTEGSGGVAGPVGDTGPSDTLLATLVAFEEQGVFAMEACPTRPLLATTSAGAGIRIWNMADCTRISFWQEFVGHTDVVNAAELLGDDDTWLFTCSDDYNVHLYNMQTFERPQVFNFEASAQCLALRPGNGALKGYVFVGGADYVVKAYPLDSNEMRPVYDACNAVIPPRRPNPFEFVSARYEGHAGRIMTIALRPDGKLMATGAHDFNIYLWKLDDTLPPLVGDRMEHDVPKFSPAARVDAHRGHVHGLAFSFAGGSDVFLASCGADHVVKVWKPTSGVMGVGLDLQWSAERPEDGAHTGVVSAITWGKGGSSDVLFSAGWDHTIKAWQGSQRSASAVSPLETMRAHSARVTDLDSSNDGRYVVSVAADFTAVIWAAGEAFSALAKCELHRGGGYVTSVSAGGSAFVTATEKGQIEVWPFPTAENAHSFEDAETVKEEASSLALAGIVPGVAAVGAGGAGGGPGMMSMPAGPGGPGAPGGAPALLPDSFPGGLVAAGGAAAGPGDA